VTQVPFLSLDELHKRLRDEITRFFENFYDSRRFILGEEVRRFEEAYARFSGTRNCVGVGNGFDAVYLALEALGIGQGDEVIVPANTYVATWLAVSRTGAQVVPAEPDPCTSNLDPARIGKVVTSRTRAVLPVHMFGQACDMVAVAEAADRHGLHVVEDNAQAQGAECRGSRTGSFGRINATSFYPSKILGALGDAGAVTTDDDALADHVRTMRNYGSGEKNIHEVVGVNSRLDEIQAGILAIKLRHLEKWIEERQRAAEWYREELESVEGLTVPFAAPGVSHVYHLYVVRCRNRDALQQYLAGHGIRTMIHYPVPPHLQQAYRDLGFGKGSFPIAEELAETSLSLPMFIGITRDQVQTVAGRIREFLDRGRVGTDLG
jgi:dTDP-4-amino-4,6-dideoxygalactose transaminase